MIEARAHVHSLIHYPVKGCGGIPVSAAEVTETGLRHDRTFLITSTDGVGRTQRVFPAMAAVGVDVLDDGKRLALSAPGVEDVELTVEPDGKRRRISMFDRPIDSVVDQGEKAASWFSEVLGVPSRLVRVSPDFDRSSAGVHPGKVALADEHAVNLVSLASWRGLNERIERAGGTPVALERFRPNIVVDGWEQPHTEDHVERLTIGDAEIGYAERTIRCNVPLVDQELGRKAGPEPVRTLATYRREPDHGGRVSFGVQAAVLRTGTIRVDDRVHVTTR